MKGIAKTRALRGISSSLLLLAWIVSLACLGLSLHLLVDDSAITPAPIGENPSTSLFTSSTSPSHPYPVIAKMGATVGLTGTGVLLWPAIWGYVKMGFDVQSFRGTTFRRWQGFIAWFYSVAIIVTTAAVVGMHHSDLNGKKNSIVALCFIIGLLVQIASLMTLLKPSRRREMNLATSTSVNGHESVESFKMDEKWNGTINTAYLKKSSPPQLDTPLLRSHSVMRKQVDYVSYLFDEYDDEEKTESGAGHESPSISRRTQSLIISPTMRTSNGGSTNCIQGEEITVPALLKLPRTKHASIHSQEIHFPNGKRLIGASHHLSTPL